MREILFKAKRLDNSEWVTGDLTQDRDLDQCFISGQAMLMEPGSNFCHIFTP